MKWRRFSVEPIVAVLKQADLGMPVADLIRQVGISEQAFRFGAWRRADGMVPGRLYASCHANGFRAPASKQSVEKLDGDLGFGRLDGAP